MAHAESPDNTLAVMNPFRSTIMAYVLAGSIPSAVAGTPWEQWLKHPSVSNAKQVERIQYSDGLNNGNDGEAITRDLRTLALRARRGEFEAIAIAVRLSNTTAPGANLEDVYEVLGRASGDSTSQFLAALLREEGGGSCPGVNFLGQEFVDNVAGQAAERRRRAQALMRVTSRRLLAIRDLCLKELRHDG